MKKTSFFFTMIILIAIDQISKFFIITNKAKFPITVINNVLQLTYCENKGIAFGIGYGKVQLISVITIIIILTVLISIYFNYSKIDKRLLLGASIMLAGGISNLLDRAFRSYVVDFIDFNKLITFPIFNIADICVVVGVIIIGIGYIYIDRGEKG